MTLMNAYGTLTSATWLARLCKGLVLLLVLVTGVTRAALPSFAFYYADDIPYESLGAFDYVVLEPDHLDLLQARHRMNPQTRIVAYLSVGEVHPSRPYFGRMRADWKLGENPAWQSVVVNLADPQWRQFFVSQVMAPLWQRGLRAFFLDTLDSFHLVATTPVQKQAQIDGLARLIEDIRTAFPQAQLVFNRGFEVLPQVHRHVFAVAAESLFRGYDAAAAQYREVPPPDRQWLWGQLQKVRSDYGLPVIAIDYVPATERELARETAARIKALGAIAWVATPGLDSVGVGQVEVLPRQVLVLHDQPGNWRDVSTHEAHRIGAMPLNHLGLEPEYVYAGSERVRQLTRRALAGRYAGVVSWFHPNVHPQDKGLPGLLRAARDQGVPQVWIGSLPGARLLQDMGLQGRALSPPVPVRGADKRSPHVGFEVQPRAPATLEHSVQAPVGEGSRVWLRWQGLDGVVDDAIAITPWGGYASGRAWKVDLLQSAGVRWSIDPIEFFRQALRLNPALPVPDATTENGRRLLITHVDGDGFASLADIPGTPLASQVMLDDFLRRYPVPSTVSIIEGEVGAKGLFAAQSARLEDVARAIFRLPHVELATHTYSHPFYWAEAELGLELPGRAMSLRVPDYRYDMRREVTGSAAYIDQHLAPAGKRTRMVLWSGDTQPLTAPLQVAYDAGLLNMNGGITSITRAEPSLSLVGPLGMMKGGYYQVYAPNLNENVYTNLWTGPFYGFERVIETFELTEAPRRLKPVNIYYHTYIASKKASIASLHKVYQWALARPLFPVHGSEYAQKVLDWRRATVARDGARLLLRNGGAHLRQWRLDDGAALPRWQGSRGLAGYVQHGQAVYLHAASPDWELPEAGAGATGGAPDSIPRLVDANGRLRAWEAGAAGEWRAEFEAHMPLRARVHAPGCRADAPAAIRLRQQGADWLIEGGEGGRQTIVFRCPR